MTNNNANENEQNNDDKTRERIRKLYQLVEKGIGGEKENAQKILDKLLAKHGITLSEITQALTTCVMDSIQNKKNIDSNQHLLVLLKSVFGNCLELTTDTSVKEVQDLIEAFHQLQANIESQEVINETSSN